MACGVLSRRYKLKCFYYWPAVVFCFEQLNRALFFCWPSLHSHHKWQRRDEGRSTIKIEGPIDGLVKLLSAWAFGLRVQIPFLLTDKVDSGILRQSSGTATILFFSFQLEREENSLGWSGLESLLLQAKFFGSGYPDWGSRVTMATELLR